MTRKETIWGARHISEEKEIKRIIESYDKLFNIEITKLEASAIQAERSKETHWTENKAKEAIRKLRGIQ